MSSKDNVATIPDVQSIARKLLNEFSGIHGSVIVAKHDHILYHENFALYDDMRTDKNAQYLIASITKISQVFRC